jgi:hypothetical protein
MLALENLTPGGSEFVDDVARCVAFIRQRQASQHQVILSLGKQLRAIRCFIADEREKVREMCADHLIKLFRDCMPDFEEIGVCRSGEHGAEWVICFDEAAFRSRIRQLDLTKDLAASSEEERKLMDKATEGYTVTWEGHGGEGGMDIDSKELALKTAAGYEERGFAVFVLDKATGIRTECRQNPTTMPRLDEGGEVKR